MAPNVTLSPAQARAIRLNSLLLAPKLAAPPKDPAEVVSWFGAMQAQDLSSGKWSFGIRLPGSTEADIDAAINAGQALRTWPMRSTVHFVPPKDARWMLELMGPRVLTGAARRRATIGLTDEDANRAPDILAEALTGGRQLSRKDCIAALSEAGLSTAGQHAYHLLWYSSQIGVTCMGPLQDGEQMFVLLDEWVDSPNSPSREEGLAIMAVRYFRSHGPSSRADFAGWTGLTAADTKLAIAGAGADLVEVSVSGAPMYLAADALAVLDDPATVRTTTSTAAARALPGFDEFLLGIKDRSLVLEPEHKQAIIPGNNGIFQPTLVTGGKVTGTWRRKVSKTTVKLTATTLTDVPASQRKGLEGSLRSFGAYLGRTAEISWAGDS